MKFNDLISTIQNIQNVMPTTITTYELPNLDKLDYAFDHITKDNEWYQPQDDGYTSSYRNLIQDGYISFNVFTNIRPGQRYKYKDKNNEIFICEIIDNENPYPKISRIKIIKQISGSKFTGNFYVYLTPENYELLKVQDAVEEC